MSTAKRMPQATSLSILSTTKRMPTGKNLSILSTKNSMSIPTTAGFMSSVSFFSYFLIILSTLIYQNICRPPPQPFPIQCPICPSIPPQRPCDCGRTIVESDGYDYSPPRVPFFYKKWKCINNNFWKFCKISVLKVLNKCMNKFFILYVKPSKIIFSFIILNLDACWCLLIRI